MARQRSVSCDSKDTDDNILPIDCNQKVPYNNTLALSSIQNEVKSRLVTLQIAKTSVSLFSLESKALLLEKKIKSISFCTKVAIFLIIYAKERLITWFSLTGN